MELVNSILRAARILDVLNDSGPLSYVQILHRLSIPKSTLFKILSTLESESIVQRDPEDGRYQLGMKLIELGGGARSRLEIRNVARPLMKDLNEEIDCTVHLTVVAHSEVVPLESVESPNWYWHHFKYPVAIGIPAPMHATGAGKAILAFLPKQEAETIIREKGLEGYTPNTITSKSKIWKEIDAIRKAGYAVSDAEHDELIRSVAAPVFNEDGKVIAALSALGVVSRLTRKRIVSIARAVVAAASEISRRLGYRETEDDR